MTYELEFPQKLIVTDSDIDDIMCTALEGGITYWCSRVEVVGEFLGEHAHEQISRDGTLWLFDSETEEFYILNREKLLKGIQTARQENMYYQYDWWNGEVLDTTQIDAEVADAIVQIALFGDIIYG